MSVARETYTGAPRFIPEEFWNNAEVGEAVHLQDFGLLIRCYRRFFSPPISQLEAASVLGVSQGQISRIEAGKTIVNDLDKLTRWSQALGFSDSHLWFNFPAQKDDLGEDEIDVEDDDSLQQVWAFPSTGSAQASTRDRIRSNHLVSSDDVSILLETVQAFRQLDNRFGGGHLRSAVAAYLEYEVEPALRLDRFSRGSRRDFQRASVELNQLVGWMAYDVGDDLTGRQHLRRALDISAEVSDDALSAEMLAAISHQAAYAGRGDEAVDFAIGAKRFAIRSGAPALQAESAALEAQGHAIRHDVQQCLSALRRAERAFSQASTTNTPVWLHYFDRAYMSAKFAHTLRELGRPTDAERFARESLQMSDGYERGKLFNTALLAGILVDQKKIGEAASCAQVAVEMASQIRSMRAWRYLNGVKVQLYPFRKSGEIKAVWPGLVALQPPMGSHDG